MACSSPSKEVLEPSDYQEYHQQIKKWIFYKTIILFLHSITYPSILSKLPLSIRLHKEGYDNFHYSLNHSLQRIHLEL